ncbi:MAG: AAA family ATPase [Planctomycetota bacterium]
MIIQQDADDKASDYQIVGLARELTVTTEALQKLGVTRNGMSWLIPERDATGDVIGQAKRFDDGKKSFVAGGNRGLTYSHPLDNYAGASMADPVFVVEGMSDVAAGLSMGLDIVGRPSATGGAEHLIELLRDRHVCIIAENDDNGAGQKGAKKIAEKIVGSVNTLRIVSPPKEYKDLRSWYAAPGGVLMQDLLELVAETPEYRPAGGPVPLATLIAQHPNLSSPVIDGLLRAGETMNVIAASKVGKSWLMYSLLASIATSGRWLDTFQCDAGPVLLIDNELHPQTIANRLPKVTTAMGLMSCPGIDVLPLRGTGTTLDRLASSIDKIEQGHYKAIVLDAWYRFIPQGLSENSNADIMGLYNLLDQYAESTGSALVAVHHASKGSQGDKAVTDVGAGAGAQSRAADAHVVLRPHEDEGHVVLEAAVRSFAPVEPLGLRWEFPLWRRTDDLDTDALKDRKTRQQQNNDVRQAEAIDTVWMKLEAGPMTPRALRDATGFGKSRLDTALSKMTAAGKVEYSEVRVRGNDTREYRRVE